MTVDVPLVSAAEVGLATAAVPPPTAAVVVPVDVADEPVADDDVLDNGAAAAGYRPLCAWIKSAWISEVRLCKIADGDVAVAVPTLAGFDHGVPVAMGLSPCPAPPVGSDPFVEGVAYGPTESRPPNRCSVDG